MSCRVDGLFEIWKPHILASQSAWLSSVMLSTQKLTQKICGVYSKLGIDSDMWSGNIFRWGEMNRMWALKWGGREVSLREVDRLAFAVMKSWFRRSEEVRQSSVWCWGQRGLLEFELLEVSILGGHLEPNLHHSNGWIQ